MDLDDLFPEAAERARKARKEGIKLQKNFHGWRGNERLHATLDAFADEWPECIPAGSKSYLYGATTKLLEEIGDKAGPRFIQWASQIIRHEKPELIDGIKTPESLIFLVARWRREGEGVCPGCGLGITDCPHEWGSQQRQKKYLGG